MKRVLLLLVAVITFVAAMPPASPEVAEASSFVVPVIDVRVIPTADIEAVVNYIRAVDTANLAAYLASFGIPIPDRGLWEALHRCEQSDSWYANGYFGNGLHGSGGLGMSDDATRMGVEAAAERGVILPAAALDQTIDQQMQTAQAFYDTYGWAWACAPYQG